MIIKLLSIIKSEVLPSEKATAEELAKDLRRAKELQGCCISVEEVERPPEGTLPFRRIKYDIIIEGDMPKSVIDSFYILRACTHFTVDGEMHSTIAHTELMNLVNELLNS